MSNQPIGAEAEIRRRKLLEAGFPADKVDMLERVAEAHRAIMQDNAPITIEHINPYAWEVAQNLSRKASEELRSEVFVIPIGSSIVNWQLFNSPGDKPDGDIDLIVFTGFEVSESRSVRSVIGRLQDEMKLEGVEFCKIAPPSSNIFNTRDVTTLFETVLNEYTTTEELTAICKNILNRLLDLQLLVDIYPETQDIMDKFVAYYQTTLAMYKESNPVNYGILTNLLDEGFRSLSSYRLPPIRPKHLTRLNPKWKGDDIERLFEILKPMGLRLRSQNYL